MESAWDPFADFDKNPSRDPGGRDREAEVGRLRSRVARSEKSLSDAIALGESFLCEREAEIEKLRFRVVELEWCLSDLIALAENSGDEWDRPGSDRSIALDVAKLILLGTRIERRKDTDGRPT